MTKLRRSRNRWSGFAPFTEPRAPCPRLFACARSRVDSETAVSSSTWWTTPLRPHGRCSDDAPDGAPLRTAVVPPRDGVVCRETAVSCVDDAPAGAPPTLLLLSAGVRRVGRCCCSLNSQPRPRRTPALLTGRKTIRTGVPPGGMWRRRRRKDSRCRGAGASPAAGRVRPAGSGGPCGRFAPSGRTPPLRPLHSSYRRPYVPAEYRRRAGSVVVGEGGPAPVLSPRTPPRREEEEERPSGRRLRRRRPGRRG